MSLFGSVPYNNLYSFAVGLSIINLFCILYNIMYYACLFMNEGPVLLSPCALLKLDFLTNECICCMQESNSPALVRRKAS